MDSEATKGFVEITSFLARTGEGGNFPEFASILSDDAQRVAVGNLMKNRDVDSSSAPSPENIRRMADSLTSMIKDAFTNRERYQQEIPEYRRLLASLHRIISVPLEASLRTIAQLAELYRVLTSLFKKWRETDERHSRSRRMLPGTASSRLSTQKMILLGLAQLLLVLPVMSGAGVRYTNPGTFNVTAHNYSDSSVTNFVQVGRPVLHVTDAIPIKAVIMAGVVDIITAKLRESRLVSEPFQAATQIGTLAVYTFETFYHMGAPHYVAQIWDWFIGRLFESEIVTVLTSIFNGMGQFRVGKEMQFVLCSEEYDISGQDPSARENAHWQCIVFRASPEQFFRRLHPAVTGYLEEPTDAGCIMFPDKNKNVGQYIASTNRFSGTGPALVIPMKRGLRIALVNNAYSGLPDSGGKAALIGGVHVAIFKGLLLLFVRYPNVEIFRVFHSFWNAKKPTDPTKLRTSLSTSRGLLSAQKVAHNGAVAQDLGKYISDLRDVGVYEEELWNPGDQAWIGSAVRGIDPRFRGSWADTAWDPESMAAELGGGLVDYLLPLLGYPFSVIESEMIEISTTEGTEADVNNLLGINPVTDFVKDIATFDSELNKANDNANELAANLFAEEIASKEVYNVGIPATARDNGEATETQKPVTTSLSVILENLSSSVSSSFKVLEGKRDSVATFGPPTPESSKSFRSSESKKEKFVGDVRNARQSLGQANESPSLGAVGRNVDPVDVKTVKDGLEELVGGELSPKKFELSLRNEVLNLATNMGYYSEFTSEEGRTPLLSSGTFQLALDLHAGRNIVSTAGEYANIHGPVNIRLLKAQPNPKNERKMECLKNYKRVSMTNDEFEQIFKMLDPVELKYDRDGRLVLTHQNQLPEVTLLTHSFRSIAEGQGYNSSDADFWNRRSDEFKSALTFRDSDCKTFFSTAVNLARKRGGNKGLWGTFPAEQP